MKKETNFWSKSLGIIGLIVLMMSMSSTVQAQDCGDILVEAEKLFDVGNFRKVIQRVNDCYGAEGQEEAVQIQLKKYLAESYIALDEVDSAKMEITTLLLTLKRDLSPQAGDSPLFVGLLDLVNKELLYGTTTSVSKRAEKIELVPATVAVITAEQLNVRGYLDVEQVLHDVSGLDVIRHNALGYTNVYQRGYRSNSTDRTLLLIDGVEDNGLWTGNAWLSRQYSLSNIKRIEVIHGPTSTIYGPNAFAGVINIETKTADMLFGETSDTTVTVGATGFGGYGTWNTRFADFSVGFDFKEEAQLVLTGRVYQSDEMNLGAGSDWASSDPNWDYQYDFYNEGFYTTQLTLENDNARTVTDQYGLSNDYYTTGTTADGTFTLIPTDTALQIARMRDSTKYNAVSYNNNTEDWYFSGRFTSGGLKLGMQVWSMDEGTSPMFTDNDGDVDTVKFSSLRGPNNRWHTRNAFSFIRYDKIINNKISITSFTRFKTNVFLQETGSEVFDGYGGKLYDIVDLMQPDDSDSTGWLKTNRYQLSQQLRSEFILNYNIDERTALVSGFEYRFSSVGGNYIESIDDVDVIEEGTVDVDDAFPGGNIVPSNDFGLFTQLFRDFKNVEGLKMNLGARLDMNQTRYQDFEDMRKTFNPRVSFVYQPVGLHLIDLPNQEDNFIFKAFYARAFKDATNFTKFSTTGTRTEPNPALKPEIANNIEVSARYGRINKLNLADYNDFRSMWISLSMYHVRYRDIVNEVATNADGTTTQNQNSDAVVRTSGLQLDYNYDRDNWSLYGNLTATHAIQSVDSVRFDSVSPSKPDTVLGILDVKVGDIAGFQINGGVDFRFFEDSKSRDHKLHVHLRTNIIGRRKTGGDEDFYENAPESSYSGTTVTNNPNNAIDAFVVFNGAITYKVLPSKWSVQLVVNNILDNRYYHPGIRTANSSVFSARIPQNTRFISARILYNF